MLLAKKPAYRHIPKIILTGHPSYTAVREALGPVLDGLPPAVDFLYKHEGLEAMQRAIENVLARHVRINWELVIQRSAQYTITVPYLVSLIEPALADEHLSHRVEECEDLLRRLFADKQQITLERLLWQRQGRVALIIVAFQTGGPLESFVVVCGHTTALAEEGQRYRIWTPKAPGETGTVLSRQAETTHFAAHAYALTKANLEQVHTLAELYQAGPEKAFHAAIAGLVQHTLPVWHQGQRGRDDTRTLDAVYREHLHWSPETLSPTAYAERVQRLLHQLPTLGWPIEHTAQTLALRYQGQTFVYPDPVQRLFQASAMRQPVVLCNTPGHLAGDNILTDGQGRTWLTDFAAAGLAPVLWSVVALEAMMRFDWVKSDDLVALHSMERCLVDSPFSKLELRDVDPALRKPVRAIQTLRRLGTQEVGTTPEPYYLGLLFQAAHRLTPFNPAVQYTRSALASFAHALLAAVVLCGKLPQDNAPGQPVEPGQAPPGVWIDHGNRAVWVNGARIALTGQSYDLLSYLAIHADALCTRCDLVEQVFGQRYDETDTSQISRLNTAVRRLREKIEDHPSQPCYLLTDPGGGYRLVQAYAIGHFRTSGPDRIAVTPAHDPAVTKG